MIKDKDWIGVDLDRTLAIRNSGDPIGSIGAPIMPMVRRVTRWLSEGKHVRIFTARVSSLHDDAEDQRRLVEEWCLRCIGMVLPVTAEKDRHMVELWDDLAVRVLENTGLKVSYSKTDDDESDFYLMLHEIATAHVSGNEAQIESARNVLFDALWNGMEPSERRRLMRDVCHGCGRLDGVRGVCDDCAGVSCQESHAGTE